MSLPPAVVSKLEKLIPMLSSEHIGERAAAASRIQSALKAGGKDMHDLAAALRGSEKIVYRDRIVERVIYQDRIVYRDRIVHAEPTPPAKKGKQPKEKPPPPEKPEFKVLSGSELAWFHEQVTFLMAHAMADLRDHERGFVEDMANKLVIGRRSFSEKQRNWVASLHSRHSVGKQR